MDSFALHLLNSLKCYICSNCFNPLISLYNFVLYLLLISLLWAQFFLILYFFLAFMPLSQYIWFLSLSKFVILKMNFLSCLLWPLFVIILSSYCYWCFQTYIWAGFFQCYACGSVCKYSQIVTIEAHACLHSLGKYVIWNINNMFNQQ